MLLGFICIPQQIRDTLKNELVFRIKYTIKKATVDPVAKRRPRGLSRKGSMPPG
jgi:hypothetical protein